MYEATPSKCTLCDSIQDDFFCHLAGLVAPTGKAIVHWITYKNLLIKFAIFLLYFKKSLP